MDSKYQALFTPWKIRDVEIKNRIVLCPMGGTSLFGWMEPNHFDKEAANFFLERAKNNVGLIIPGIAPIRDTIGGRWLYQNKKMFRELKAYMEKIHATGAKLFVQITAGMGRSWGISDEVVHLHKNPVLRVLAKPILDTNYQMASPSVLPSRWAEGITCPEMTLKQIEEIIEAFGKTAALCKEAGVDGVEVHAVHEGYLLDQFAMKYTNHRKDAYGGSFENRYRFAAEIVKNIKKVCGSDYPVSLRYSVISKVKDFCYGALPGENYQEIGRDMEESEKAAKFLQDAGYDMLNADNGTYDSWYWAHPPMYMPQNCNLEDVAAIRQVVDIPVVCAGRMEPDTAAQAIREGRNPEFREKYRSADVFLMDDVQFIAGRESTQEEMFHTFNTLYEAGRQIVFTADRPPKEMLRLDDRLRTRFEWGLPVDIQPPDYETRMAIIKNKAIRMGVELPEFLLQLIAENITANVRQIEGTVNKIMALRDLEGSSIDAATVTRAVRDMFKDPTDIMPTADVIIEEVCSFYNIENSALRGQGRTKDTALARQIAMYQIRRMTNLSLKEIGKEFDNRDHTTVMHSIDRIEKLTKQSPEIAEVIKDINANINARYE